MITVDDSYHGCKNKCFGPLRLCQVIISYPPTIRTYITSLLGPLLLDTSMVRATHKLATRLYKQLGTINVTFCVVFFCSSCLYWHGTPPFPQDLPHTQRVKCKPISLGFRHQRNCGHATNGYGLTTRSIDSIC